MSLLKSEIIETTFKEMVKDPSHLAVNVNDILAEIEKNGCTVSRDNVGKFLRNAYRKDLVEYKITSKGKCWRLRGASNPFPPEYNELIFDAVREINEETGKPATTTQVMEKIGDILDRESVNVRLKRLVYIDRTLLFAGNAEKSGAHTYVVNAEEHKPIMNEIRRNRHVASEKKSIVEETIERLGGYMRRDIYYARSHTHVGDEFDVYVKKTGLHNNDHDIEKRHLKVSKIKPHICIFEDGTSLPWIDFAALYMNNRRLTQTMY